MPIFYRADTRSPEDIFNFGFTPRGRLLNQPSQDKNWYKFGINSQYHRNAVADANSYFVTCMTTKFNSAPIFPVDVATGGDTYVYAISLPEEEVFDLYAYQIRQARDICAMDGDSNSGYVAVGLCGYEAFTPEVKPDNIIAAVKCTRSSLKAQSAGLKVHATHDYRNYMIPFDRDFKVGSNIFKNKNFNPNNNVEKLAIQQEIIQDLEKKLDQSYTTTSISEAVIAGGLPAPKSEALFMVHLRGGYIRSAIWSVFVSISEAFKALGAAIIRCFSAFKWPSKPASGPTIVELGINNSGFSSEQESSLNPKSGIFNAFVVDTKINVSEEQKQARETVDSYEIHSERLKNVV
jgi:hypothetical protein